jgi:hypothetical protein
MKREMQAESLSEVSELGQVVTEHTYRGSRVQRTWLVLGIACIVIVVAAPIGLILLAVALLQNYRVRVCTGGLELINGKKRRACPWREIEAFWERVTVNQATLAGIPVVRGAPIHQYRVRLRKGKEVRFEENYRDVEAVGNAIRAGTVPLLVARARAACNRGEEVEFGSIRVSKERLGQANRNRTWKELTEFEVRIDEGFFYVSKGPPKKTWAGERFEDLAIMAAIADIPNFAVLLTLIGEHLTVPEPIRRAFCEAEAGS